MKDTFFQYGNLRLSRSEMKKIRGGLVDDESGAASCEGDCRNGKTVKCGPCGSGIKCYAQSYNAQGGAPLSDGGCHCGTDSWTVCASS